MALRDLIPFHWKKEPKTNVSRLPAKSRDGGSSLDALFRDFDEFTAGFFDQFGALQPWSSTQGGRSLRPTVNVSESKKEIQIDAELPGLDEKDINVSVERNHLIIRGEKKQENRDENDRVHRVECSYGYFERTIPLPEYAVMDKSKASYKNGVLKIRIPKDAKKESGKTIPITVG